MENWLGTAAADPVKDQTDNFLARISYDQLRHLIFPLGRLPKSEVRRIAEEVALPKCAPQGLAGHLLRQGKINCTTTSSSAISAHVRDR